MQQTDQILVADAKILSIPIVDNQEPLVNIAEIGGIAFGPSPEIPNNTDYTFMRKSVYEKLLKAQELLPKGLRFCLYEAYRSLSLQKMLFDNRYDTLTNLYPTWTHEQIFLENIKMIAPVINLDGSKNIPPHSTGGAIDVYLINDDGNAVDMGIHPKDWMEDLDGSFSLTASTIISNEAKYHRKLMSDALTAVGFVNYYTEYWHWSYGDRYWAFYKKAANAIYSSYL